MARKAAQLARVAIQAEHLSGLDPPRQTGKARNGRQPLGVWLAQRLPSRPLLMGFAAVLAWTAWRMFRLGRKDVYGARATARQQPCRIDPRDGRLRWTVRCAWALGTTGVAAGLLSGLLGVGGGFVIVPSLTRHTDLDARSIAATSLAVIAMSALSGIVAAGGQGSLNWRLAITFGAGAILALWAAYRVGHRLPPAALQRSFAVVSAVVSVLMLARALGWLSA